MYENASIIGMKDKMPSTTLRFEDFVQNPQLTLQKSLNELGYSSINLEKTISSLSNLKPTHSIGGNPIRFSKKNEKIIPNNEWVKHMSLANKFIFGLIGYPILNRYEYNILPKIID
jgi:hypothetical protein